MDKLIREDYVLGNKKIVVGDNLHDLVLENLGKIWIRYGNSYKDFQSFISTVSTSSSNYSKVIIEPSGLKSPSDYKNGALVYDARKQTLYLKYQNSLLLLLEYNNSISEKYVNKRGDKMTGPLEIEYDGVPLKINSARLIENLNSEYLQGKTPDHFALKALNEVIAGNWTFQGHDTHNGLNVFNNKVTINGELEENSKSTFLGKADFKNEIEVQKTGTFKDGNVAIKVGTGDIVTDGSMGSSQFMSGMTGYGWRLDASSNTLTIDNLIVRGILNVFELVVNKITATNGSLWVTDCFKIDKMHDIIYLTDDDISAIELNEDSLKTRFNEDAYYIPICNSFKRTITPDKSSHPYATRDNKTPEGEDTPSFDFLNWIFKINNLKDFINKFIGTETIVEREVSREMPLSDLITLLQEEYGYNIYIDEENYYRISGITFDGNYVFNDLTKLPTKEDVDRDPERDLFFKIYEESLSLTQDRGLKEEDGHLNITVLSKENFTEQSSATNTLNQIFNEAKLKEFAAEGVIEISHVFQKDPKNVLELETIPDSQIAIYPDGVDELTSQLYVIVNSRLAELQSEGYYLFDSDALCSVNLYYKYFGSTINNGLNLYIMESDHSEYPVFKPGDILKCQKFTGTSVTQYHALVLGLVSEYSFIVQLLNYSILQEGTKYSYNEDGELLQTSAEIGTNLYERSEGLRDQLDFYLDDAKEALRSLALGGNIPDAQIDWCLQILLPEEMVDSTKQQLLNVMSDPIALSAKVEEIIGNSINGLSSDELLEHPIFKKVLEDSTKNTPMKGDSLVRIGSILFGDRRNSMYLTSSEANSPYTDVLVGVNRPDYTVVYLTPKYVRFEATLEIDGENRKGTYYVQDNTFSTMIKNKDNGANIPQQWQDLYNKYRPFITSILSTNDPNADIRSVVLTFLPEENTVYNSDGSPMMLTVNNNSYFVSTDVLDGIINGETTLNELDSDKCSNYKIDEDTTITLLIGGESYGN